MKFKKTLKIAYPLTFGGPKKSLSGYMEIEKSPWSWVWDSKIISMRPIITPFALFDTYDLNEANNHKNLILEVHKKFSVDLEPTGLFV